MTQKKEQNSTPNSFEAMDSYEKEAQKGKQKEKKGFFDRGNPVTEILTTVGSLILANIFFIICSLPVFTMGAALTALNRCCYDIMDMKDVRVAKQFFKTFGTSFLQATPIWIIACGFLSAAGFGLHWVFTNDVGEVTRLAVVIASIMISIPTLMVISYYFMVIGRYENDIMAQLRNAFLMAFIKLGWTILIWLLWGSVIAIFVFAPGALMYGGWLLLMIGFALMSYATVHIYQKVFQSLAKED